MTRYALEDTDDESDVTKASLFGSERIFMGRPRNHPMSPEFTPPHRRHSMRRRYLASVDEGVRTQRWVAA